MVHRPLRHPTDTLHLRILNDVAFDGVSSCSLQALNIDSTPAFMHSAEGAIKTLDNLPPGINEPLEYAEGFSHCIPLNPSYIAKNHPDIYMWGLDPHLLDLIESLLGLPPLYHGVIIRKELVDNNCAGTRQWHTDFEDHNTIRVCIYLSDVLDANDGAFEYVPKTIPLRWTDFDVNEIDDEHMRKRVPEWLWKQVTGPKWTVSIKAVSKIFHHGKVPNKPRVAASFYYTSRKPSAPELCEAFSFKPGMPHLKVSLNERQLDCLGGYRDLLC